MAIKLPKLIATSVVRGNQQGESHGGVYMVDFEKREVEQYFDLNTTEIDFKDVSGDRGMRGIAISEEDVLIAASDVLFRCDRSFKIKTFSRNHYLDDCHEICRYERTIFLTSPKFDSLLAFDLDTREYVWGFHLLRQYDQWAGHTFDPQSDKGPLPVNEYHINMVHVDRTGIYLSGLYTKALLHLNNKMEVSEVCSLPGGVHNARPYRDGVLLNDTESDCVRYAGHAGTDQVFKIITYDESDIEFADIEDPGVVRQGFGRGLCPVGDRFVAGGSAPSTVSLYDLETNQTVGSVNLTMDVRNAIHGLEVWPYGD
jgi:hypothetical protein